MADYLLEEALMEMLDGVKLYVDQREAQELEKQRLIDVTHERARKALG